MGNFDRTPRTTMFRNTMITMPLIATLAAGLTPQAKNLIRRFAEQGAYTAGQTTPPVPKSRRRLPVKAIDLKDALSKAENLVGALKRLKTPTKRGRVPPPPPPVSPAGPLTLARMKTMTAKELKDKISKFNHKALKDAAKEVGDVCVTEVTHEARLWKIREVIVKHVQAAKR